MVVASFEEGQLVRMKGGGPAMTVVGTLNEMTPGFRSWVMLDYKEGDILCRWQDQATKMEKIHPFDPDWLKPV